MRHLVVLAIAAVAVLGACEQEADKKSGGTVKPASSESTATTTAPSSTATTAKATTSTTAKPATTSTTVKPSTTTTERLTTTTTAPTAGEAYYANCDAARAAGVAPIMKGQPGYRSGLDRDGDGIACDK